jgi:hypothetical protein
MKIVMIDITNACHKSCSNCTRLCGQHPKPFFMDTGTFKRAVDSMRGFQGIVGIIGGEPTLHPNFAEMVDYYQSRIREPRPYSFIRPPVDTFQIYASTVKYQRGRKRGLFSSLGPGYYKNFEQIQDVFAYQGLNDHSTVNTHQAIMVTRKELGIPDQEWFKLRDNCWIQNLWSASITPKGAFFCEIAASLDMLFDGNGGWPIEPGWWKRKPIDFGEQLNWCEMCSVALRVPTMAANEETDIVSPLMMEKLKKVNGPKVRKNKMVILEPATFDPDRYGHETSPIWYLPKEQGDVARVSPTHDTMFPRRVDIGVLKGESPQATLSLSQIEQLKFNDWVAVFEDNSAVNTKFIERIPKCVLNPGCFYYYGNDVMLFHRRAKALRGVGFIKIDSCLIQRWEKKKCVRLHTYPRIGELTLLEKLSLLMNKIHNRGAFMLPVFGSRLRSAEGNRDSCGSRE